MNNRAAEFRKLLVWSGIIIAERPGSPASAIRALWGNPAIRYSLDGPPLRLHRPASHPAWIRRHRSQRIRDMKEAP